MPRNVDKRTHGLGTVGPKALTCVVEHHCYFAINIELALVEGGIADTDRPGAFVAVEPVKFHFGETALASNAVHDLHLSWIAGDRAQHPLEECLCFIS